MKYRPNPIPSWKRKEARDILFTLARKYDTFPCRILEQSKLYGGRVREAQEEYAYRLVEVLELTYRQAANICNVSETGIERRVKRFLEKNHEKSYLAWKSKPEVG